MCVDGLNVRANVKETTNAGDDFGKRPHVGKVDRDAQTLSLQEVRDSDVSDGAVDLYCSSVAFFFYYFDARDCARLEEAEHGVPVIGWPIAYAKSDACVGTGKAARRLSPECARWTLEEILEDFVEPAQAAEARCHGDFCHGHASFVDEMFGEEDAPGLRDCDWRGSEVFEEEPSELTLAEAETLCKCVYAFAFAIEGSFGDECERTGDCVGGSTP